MILAMGTATLCFATSVPAQVVIRGTESSDNSVAHSAVNVKTMDRTVVPLLKDVRQTKPDANTEVINSVTRGRLNDGTYFDWRRASTIEKQIAPDETRISTVVTEKDRQGGDRTIRGTTETVNKTDRGENSEAKVYSRNSSGQLVLDQVVDVNTVSNANGRADTIRTEKVADVNGNIIVQQQNEETSAAKGPNQDVTTALTKSVDHLTGRIDVTGQASTTIRTEDGTKQIDTVVRAPGRMGWEVRQQTTTTEKTAPDGSRTRETIEHGRSLYAVHTGDQLMEPLVPQRKVVEQEVRNPDGTIAVQRDVFRRDVNGEWKHESFSTVQPDMGIGQRPPSVPTGNQPVAPPPEAAPPKARPN